MFVISIKKNSFFKVWITIIKEHSQFWHTPMCVNETPENNYILEMCYSEDQNKAERLSSALFHLLELL